MISLHAIARPARPDTDYINVKVPLPVIEKIDRLATRRHQSRAETVRQLLAQGLLKDWVSAA